MPAATARPNVKNEHGIESNEVKNKRESPTHLELLGDSLGRHVCCGSLLVIYALLLSILFESSLAG
jgi:hypothetical protein